jgi:hypothetical protein
LCSNSRFFSLFYTEKTQIWGQRHSPGPNPLQADD